MVVTVCVVVDYDCVVGVCTVVCVVVSCGGDACVGVADCVVGVHDIMNVVAAIFVGFVGSAIAFVCTCGDVANDITDHVGGASCVGGIDIFGAVVDVSIWYMR